MAGGTDLYCPVFFDYPDQARQGVSMREPRLKGVLTPIQGPNPTIPYSHTRDCSGSFSALSYGHVEWCRTILVTSPTGAPITRVALGVQIASRFAHFVEKSQCETPTSRDWMVTPSCVRFEQHSGA
ncbi:hypothetical protein B0H14DRAFT_2579789 [Mycena olivaceomarginata]|nr:hypothetical protein B0H14DRAFT_2579789 [Mycena olivaceomarginata]